MNEKSGEEGCVMRYGRHPSEDLRKSSGVAVSELLPVDPFAHLAKAAGYDDPELWWEVNF